MQANNNTYNPATFNQINNNSLQPIQNTQPPTNLPPITKNYATVPLREPTHVFTTVLLYIVTAVVFFGAGYVTRMWQDAVSPSSKSKDTVSQTPSTEDADIKNWDTYTHDMLNLNINHPSSWTVSETAEESNGCTAIIITLTNGDYSFIIDSACNANIQECTYNNNDTSDNDVLSFNEFTEIAANSTSYRRALQPDKNFAICVKSQNQYLSYTVPFGYITYEVPENYSDDMIAIMDYMLISLTDSPAKSSNDMSPIGCTSDNAQYNIGDTFEDADGCNTCTCQSDGNIICTTEECMTPTEDVQSEEE